MIQILEVSCSSAALGSILNAFQKILKLIQIIVPILLMVGLMIHITNLMQNPDDKKLQKKIFNSVIAAVIVFFIPTLINAIMGLLGENFSVSSCWNSINNPGTGGGGYVDPYNTSKKSGFISNSSDYEKGEKKKTGVPLDTTSGFHRHVYDGLVYYIYLPPNATTNMPLLLWLHGDNGRVEWTTNNRIGETAYKAGVPVIMVSPLIEDLGSSAHPGWYEGGLLPKIKEIVDSVCTTYQCDKTNINIGGHSRGAIGTWMMVSKYPNYFHAAAPVSCCSFYGMKGSSFKGMKVWAFRGSNAGTGDNNDNKYAACMQNDINTIKPYAKEVRYTIQPNTTHGDATDILRGNQDFVRFMFTD